MKTKKEKIERQNRNIFASASSRLSTLVAGMACAGLMLQPAAWSGTGTETLENVAGPIVILKVADLHVTGADSMAEFKEVIAFANAAIHPTLTFIAGDTPHNGALAEYEAYKQVRDTLKGPVFDVAGDHEAKGGGLEHYRKVLGEPTYSFALGKEWQVVGLNSAAIDDAQIEWARKELEAARGRKRAGIIFIHHNFAGLKDKTVQEKLNRLVSEGGVKLVLAGHTHNNSVINDGASVQITTTSIKEPRGSSPRGYAIITLDEGRAAWHFVPLGQRPVVAVCNPVDKLMVTGPEGVVSGKCELRVKVFDSGAVQKVTASVDGGSAIELSRGKEGLWTGQWDSTGAPDGEHKLKVEAIGADGKTGVEELAFIVSKTRQYVAAPATISDAKAGGGKGPKAGGPPDGGQKGKGKKQPVNASELPAAVKAALEKRAGKVEFSKLEKEKKGEQEIYTAKWGAQGGDHEVKLDAAGVLVEEREMVAFESLPANVRDAVQKRQADAKTFECKKIASYSGDKATVVYEVRAQGEGGKQPPLRVGPDGELMEGPKGKAK